MDLADLYAQVTTAIGDAKDLDTAGDPKSASAHLSVSHLEEEIAELVEPWKPEGAIARRGAVRAAVAGKDFDRAEALVARFGAEMIPDQRNRLAALLPRVVAPKDVTEHLRRVLEESRAKCISPQPCPALNQATVGVGDVIADFDVSTGWVVLASTPADVPEGWTASDPIRVMTFDECAKRLARLVQEGTDVCEPRCVALPAARTRFKEWLDKLRDHRDLVVIRT